MYEWRVILWLDGGRQKSGWKDQTGDLEEYEGSMHQSGLS